MQKPNNQPGAASVAPSHGELTMLSIHELFQLFVQGRADERVWKIQGDLDTAFDAFMLSFNAQMDAQQVLSFTA